MSRTALLCVQDKDADRRARIERILALAHLPLRRGGAALPGDLIVAVAGWPLPEADASPSSSTHATPDAPAMRVLWLLPEPEEAPARAARARGLDAIADGLNPAVLVPAASARLYGAVTDRGLPLHSGLIGESAAIRAVRDTIGRVAASDITVLVTGETGAGKECVANGIHGLSRRANGPLIALNCAAIPDAMLEGELFGYERGAFTGAAQAFPGKLRLAHRGTLFLDEVADLPLAGQAKILRAIETREVQALGAVRSERFDARLIAATNADLSLRAEDGGFRKDLYYRLAVAVIDLPPLRARRDDIPLLARHLLVRLASEAGTEVPELAQAALERLCAHAWPGNVRELINALQVAMLYARDGLISLDALPASLGSVRPMPASTLTRAQPASQPMAPALDLSMGEIIAALSASGGNKSLAARRLRCSRMTLYRKLAENATAPQLIPVRTSHAAP